jgi:hypothetical protein
MMIHGLADIKLYNVSATCFGLYMAMLRDV